MLPSYCWSFCYCYRVVDAIHSTKEPLYASIFLHHLSLIGWHHCIRLNTLATSHKLFPLCLTDVSSALFIPHIGKIRYNTANFQLISCVSQGCMETYITLVLYLLIQCGPTEAGHYFRAPLYIDSTSNSNTCCCTFPAHDPIAVSPCNFCSLKSGAVSRGTTNIKRQGMVFEGQRSASAVLGVSQL